MTGSRVDMEHVRLPTDVRASWWEMDSSLAAAAEYDAPRSPLLERLAKASQGRATVVDLLAQAAGIAALAVATLGMWLAGIWE